MDGADLAGMLVITLVIAAGLASFAVAGLFGGAVASLLLRGGRVNLAAWAVVVAVATTVGLGALLVLIVVEDAHPALVDLPLGYGAWLASALSGSITRVELSSWAPTRPSSRGAWSGPHK